jgi:sporulation protein YlmC with PRC-barrel domain
MSEALATEETDRLIASDRVEGTLVYDRAGEKIGSVRNFMVGKQSGQVEYAVLQFGGFLGIGNEYYPIPWEMLSYHTDQHGYVVNLDKQQVESAPRYSAESPSSFDHRYGRTIYDYYGIAYPFI